MIDPRVLISIISGACGVLTAYITAAYRTRAQRPKNKDRIDTAFEAYEKIIREQQTYIDRLVKENETLRQGGNSERLS